MTTITPVIGRNEMIELADHSVKNIPAKIDTGADSCSIWATNIREENGIVYFSLFGAGSTYYTGEELQTDHYKVVGVKNSFGEREVRYTVWLPIRLNGKRYRVRFNLADRSRNHFPILLGKRFLNKKFLVDVSRNYLLSPPEMREASKKVLILTAKKDQKAEDFFTELAKDLKGSVDLVHYDELIFTMGTTPSVTVAATGYDLAGYDLVYFKSHKRYIESAMAVASYLRYKNVIYRDEELDAMISHSKVSEMMELSTHQLDVPETIVAPHNYLAENAQNIVEQLGFPLVLKDVFSDRGKNNFLIKTLEDFKKVLAESSKECLFAAQKYIPNDGFVRVLVLGREVEMLIKRDAVGHEDPLKEHLNKPSGSDNAKILDVGSMDSAVKSMALKAAEAMHRQIAGVDVLQDKATGKWYILEVNASPQLYTGKYSKQKALTLAKYFNDELERW